MQVNVVFFKQERNKNTRNKDCGTKINWNIDR